MPPSSATASISSSSGAVISLTTLTVVTVISIISSCLFYYHYHLRDKQRISNKKITRRRLLHPSAAAATASATETTERWNSIPSNHLLSLKSLRHHYYIVRHGESTANVEGIISSNPVIATKQHGLTALGRQQAIEAAHQLHVLLPSSAPSSMIRIYSSDFSRAQETASIIQQTLRLRQSILINDFELRERSFGLLDGLSNSHYQQVWDCDAQEMEREIETVDENENINAMQDVESVNQVMARITGWLVSLESDAVSPSGSSLHIVIVSHGDTLQILQCAFNRMDPHLHRQVAHLHNGEVREMKLISSETETHESSSSVSKFIHP